MNEKRLITSRQLRDRIGGVSAMAIWRWSNDPELCFPKPIVINNLRYWREEEIEAWLESQRETAA
jgi:predicted DNA-binding transcriptional regulator AlpA